MGKGDNIRQRKDGRYEARYVKERTETGKAIYASVYGKTYEEASRKRDEILGINYLENHSPKGLGLLILGAGSHGQEVQEIASALNVFCKITLLDDDPSKEAAGPWSDAETLKSQYACAIVDAFVLIIMLMEAARKVLPGEYDGIQRYHLDLRFLPGVL